MAGDWGKGREVFSSVKLERGEQQAWDAAIEPASQGHSQGPKHVPPRVKVIWAGTETVLARAGTGAGLHTQSDCNLRVGP